MNIKVLSDKISEITNGFSATNVAGFHWYSSTKRFNKRIFLYHLRVALGEIRRDDIK